MLYLFLCLEVVSLVLVHRGLLHEHFGLLRYCCLELLVCALHLLLLGLHKLGDGCCLLLLRLFPSKDFENKSHRER